MCGGHRLKEIHKGIRRKRQAYVEGGTRSKEKKLKKNKEKNNRKNQEHVVYFYMHEKSSVVGWLKHE